LPRKVFADGDVLPASDLNTFLMNQSVMTFTNSTARNTAIPTPVEGMLVYLAATDHYESYNGTAWVDAVMIGAWRSWAPVLSNGFANGNGVWSGATYMRVGRTVHFKASFVTGTTTTYGTGMRISLPFSATASEHMTLTGYIQRGTTRYPLVATDGATNYVTVAIQNAAGTFVVQVSPTSTTPHTWTTGDQISIAGTYEAA
jgi:hypothetical protein